MFFACDCILCAATDSKQPICPKCANTLPVLEASCRICALPLRDHPVCGQCLAHRPHFDGTFAAWVYAYPVDRLVQSFKFQHRLDLAPLFASALLQKIQAAQLPVSSFVIVPMPLHRSRLLERGFNQALEIARQVASITHGTLLPFAVEKHRETRLQSEMPLKERKGNVRGAYRCIEPFTSKRVLVIDDVMTTGASLNELARTLKQAGATEVVNLVVARTLRLDGLSKGYR